MREILFPDIHKTIERSIARTYDLLVNFQVSEILKQGFLSNLFDAFESYADNQNPYENVDELCNLVAENTKLDRSDVLYASNKDAILDGNICYKFTSFIIS